MVLAAALAPTQPGVLYHLARAAARSDRPANALCTLARLAPLGAGRDPGRDATFDALRGMGGFRRLRREIARQATPVVRSDTAFHIHVTDLVPENLAYDGDVACSSSGVRGNG